MLIVQSGHFGKMTESGEIIEFNHPTIQRPQLQSSELIEEQDHSKRLYSAGASVLRIANTTETR